MKRFVTIISLTLVFFTVWVTIFVLENLTFVLEEATILSKRPIKTKIEKNLIQRDIPYDPKSGSHLDVYAMPKKEGALKKYPVLIFLHGGLWQGSNKKHFKHIADIAHRQDFVTVIPQFPHYYGMIRRSLLSEEKLSRRRIKAQMRALRQTIFWIQKSITQYEGNPQDLFLMAFGSGAQMAGTLLFSERYLDLNIRKNFKKMIFVSPILDLERTNRMFQEQNINPVFKKESLKLFSPSFLFKENKGGLNIPILILSPEFDYPFLQFQSQEFSKESSLIRHEVIPNSTRKSIVFDLGKKNRSTEAVINFMKI